jgi:hypothetical protein
MYTTFLYTVWLLIPGAFFLIALWARLEQLSKSAKKHNPGDFLRQGFFLLGCSAIAILADHYGLSRLEGASFTDWAPLGLLQLLLLPAIWLIAAQVFGGSRAVSIKDPSSLKKQSKGK